MTRCKEQYREGRQCGSSFLPSFTSSSFLSSVSSSFLLPSLPFILLFPLLPSFLPSLSFFCLLFFPPSFPLLSFLLPSLPLFHSSISFPSSSFLSLPSFFSFFCFFFFFPPFHSSSCSFLPSSVLLTSLPFILLSPPLPCFLPSYCR